MRTKPLIVPLALVLSLLVLPLRPASADDVEHRIAQFWQRVDALAPSDLLTATDLGQWALNVIERDPGAGLTVADFRASTAAMQAAFDRAGAGILPGTPRSPDVEGRIAIFWAKVDALGPADLLSAADLGQWALNVTDRDPNKRIRVDDFRASTASMQGGFERARSLPRPATPTPTPTPSPAPVRSAADRPDDASGPQIHLVYVLPADGSDESLDTNGRIARSATTWQSWLSAQTGGRTLRIDSFNGAPDITFVRIADTDAQMRARDPYIRNVLESRLITLGFTKADTIYAVYYGGSSGYSCGGGAWPPLLTGTVAALYLKGEPPGSPACATHQLGVSPGVPGYLEYGMLHEIIHTLGVVAECAPHHTRAGHTSDDPRDLMYSGDQPWGIYEGLRLDIGRDDYYGHGRAGCADLATSSWLVR